MLLTCVLLADAVQGYLWLCLTERLQGEVSVVAVEEVGTGVLRKKSGCRLKEKSKFIGWEKVFSHVSSFFLHVVKRNGEAGK